MIALAAILALIPCEVAPLTLDQAKRLVLAAPNIQAAVKKRGARPRFDWIQFSPKGWRFDVNSATECRHSGACSTMLGHFAVNRQTGEVEDLDAAGGTGAVISSQEIRQLKLSRRQHCR